MKVSLIQLMILFLLSSCTDYAEVVIDDQGASIDWKSGGVSSIRVEPWHVGPQRKQLLSMGARVKIELPPLKEEDIELLGKKYDVDSWLITLMVSKLGRKERLASYFVPLFKRSGRSGATGVSNTGAGYLDLFYAAAALSSRLRSLECPGLGHRLLLEDVVVRELSSSRPLLVISRMQEYSYQGKAEKLDFQRNIINLGASMAGEYQVSFAFYNSKRNRVLSNDALAPQVIVLGNEKNQSIRGCESLKTPPAGSDGKSNMENFKFGR